MPNEFEKIVQQKMEELRLVPSEPVWQKVEMQIRKKKDRRRVIFWFSFLILLLGGGLWVGIDQYTKNTAFNRSNTKTQKQNPVTTPDIKTAITLPTTTGTSKKITGDKVQGSKKETNDKLIVNNSENKNDNDIEPSNKIPVKLNKDVVANASPIKETTTLKQSSQKTKAPEEKLFYNEKEMQVDNDTVLAKTKFSEIIIEQPFEKVNQIVPSLDIIRADVSISAFPIEKIQFKPTVINPDSLKHDTVSVKKAEAKKYAESKWKYNLVAASGLSGLSRLNVFSGMKSADALYAASPSNSQIPGVTYYSPSPVRKGLSFSIGGTMQKQLSKRLQFSAGLQYNYYSNSILVGNRINRDTVFRYAYAVSQYFQNNAATYSLALEPYHNHYHFISLPLAIDWRMFNKLPLNFHTGFSVQQMIQTNALLFDYNAQAYYHNNKAFNKTLVLTEYGLSYSIQLKKKYLAIGPEFQYGLPRLEKNNPDHHLFSYGLKAQLQLNKK